MTPEPSEPSKPSVPSVPPIFLLPIELRNRIYHFAFLGQRTSFMEPGIHLFLQYMPECNIEPDQDSQGVRWLLTNRQILSEGLQQFYVHATLTDNYIMQEQDIEYVTHDLTLDGKRSVFELSRLRAASLRVRMGSRRDTSQDDSYDELIVPRGKETYSGSDDDFSALGKAIAKLDNCALKVLELDVSLFRTEDRTGNWEASGNRFIVQFGDEADEADEGSDEDSDAESAYDSDDSYTEQYWNSYGTNLQSPDETTGYVADFSFLKNLGTSWQKVKIKYTPTYMERYWGDEDPVAANVLAVPIIEEGLAKTAQELVGGDGWVLRDSLEEGGLAAVWVLDVEWRNGAERTGCLEHVGLHNYLAPCDECNTREEKFRREPGEHGMVKFVGESCGYVVEFETPVCSARSG